jgi:hypothetical protein
MARDELLSGEELPSRAKPQVLFQLCQDLDTLGRTLRGDLYDEMDADRRQISAACDYGEVLRIIEQDDVGRNTPFVDVGEHGYGFTVADSFESSTAQNVFRKAIPEYEPYLCTILFTHKLDITSIVNEERAITKTDAKTALSKALDIDAEDREINLFFKTAQAAGLGERVIGRRQFETRFVVNDEFDTYAEKLFEAYGDEYDIDEETSDGPQSDVNVDVSEFITDDEQEQETSSERAQNGDSIGAQGAGDAADEDGTGGIIAHLQADDVTLKIDVDISGKSDEEVLNVVNQIKSLE